MKSILNLYLKILLKKRNSEAGFNLLELMLSLAIIGLLIAVFAAPAVVEALNRGRSTEAKANISNIATLQQNRYSDLTRGGFANTFQELQNLPPGEVSVYSATPSYTYQMEVVGRDTPNPSVIIDAIPNNASYPVARGRVFLQPGPVQTICVAPAGSTINIQNVNNPSQCEANIRPAQ